MDLSKPLRISASVLAVFASSSVSAFAQADVDYVRLPGKVSSAVLHRAITCGAEPGRDCLMKPIKWLARDARRLTVGFVAIDDTYPNRHNPQASKSLNLAIN